MIGIILGNRYELLDILGEGGMAVVYKARDKKLNRLVAVKVLKKEFADNTQISEKFKIEATAVANLSDMNIVNVLDVGHEEEEENIDYFVMELVEGKTLKDIINYNGKLSYKTSIDIAIQVAKALDCAHRNNIVHRDIKPENILVTEHKDIKVTDFGIAKSATSATITNTTTIMGSAHYLSPEQAKGIYIDGKTDLYSLGVVLYEMVTGVLPFEGESPVTIALKHIQEVPLSPKERNESIPESLSSLILKLMSKDPIDRYQSAKELIADLQRIKRNPDIKISNVYSEDKSETIVMSPIKTYTEEKRINNNENKKGYLVENDENDDYEEESNKGKIIGIIVGLIIATIALAFIFMNMFGEKKPKIIVIPNLITEDISYAQSKLEGLGLKVSVVETESDVIAGMVIKTDPKSGAEVEEGTTVNIVVSAGVEKIKVPDLRDFEKNYIIQILEQEGLNFDIDEVFDDEIEKGYFIKQDPKAGTEIIKDDIIHITISKGAEVKFVAIENYIGLSIDKIKTELEKKGLEVRIKEVESEDKAREGIILSQSLEIGKKVEEGYPITLEVGVYVEPSIEVGEFLEKGMILKDGLNKLTTENIKYQIEGGVPEDTTKYKIVSFTELIKSTETVQINIEKIEEEPEIPEENQDDENLEQNLDIN